MPSSVRARSGLRSCWPGRGASPPGRKMAAVTGAGHGGREVAREREPAEGGVRLAPAVDGAGRGEGGRKDAAPWNLSEAAPVEPFERARGGGATARVQEAHNAAARVPDQPELIAADARHVRVDDGEDSARRDGGIHGGAARFERIDPGHGGESMWGS